MASCQLFVTFVLIGASWAYAASDNERILGGTNATSGQFPYTINMYYKEVIFICGGAIISPFTILTAAHCILFNSEDLVIYAGSIERGKGLKRQVATTKVHDNYSRPTLENDIALVILETHLEFSDTISTIEIDEEHINAGLSVIASGWGMTSYPRKGSDVLLYLNLVTVDQEECKTAMLPSHVFDSHLCAYSGEVGKGTCLGDSGGPLALDGKLVGIVSGGKELCAKGAPDIYARVSKFVEWIHKYMK